MTTFNGINTTRLESFARRLLGIRQGGIMPSLSPEASVEIPLPYTMDQLALSESWPFGAASSIAGVAAQFAAATLSNLSTNLIVTVKFYVGAQSTAGLLTLFRSGPGVVAGAMPPGRVSWSDSRRPRDSFPAGSLFFEEGTLAVTPPAGAFFLGRQLHPANEMVELPEVVLAPGEAVGFYHSVANTTVYWQAVGTVRAVLRDELTAS